MTLSRDLLPASEIAAAIEEARDLLRRGEVSVPDARDIALALVQLSTTCVVGSPCDQHGGAIHGQEAEELRAGVEQILRNTSDVRNEDAVDVLAAIHKALIFLLDRVDARDSLAFREATDPKDPEEGQP